MKNALLISLLFSFHLANAQWTTLNSGTSEVLNEVFFPTAETGYVIGNNGTILKTSNGGSDWSFENTGLSVNFSDLYFISELEGWVVGDSGSICHTMDGGDIWNCTFLDSAERINLHSVFALNSAALWVGGTKDYVDGYLASSKNAGITWKIGNAESYIWSVDFKKIAMINAYTGYAITRGYVVKTNDGGLNWHITDTASVQAGELFNVLEDLAVFPNSDTVYTCGWYSGYLGKTTNGGDKWVANNEFQNYNLDFINTEIGYIGGWGQVHKTSSGGATFVDASGGNSELFNGINSIDFVDEWTGYACGENGKILKTTNGGLTAIAPLSLNTIIDIYPNPSSGQIYFSTTANIQISTITGETIAEQKNVQSFDLSSLPAGVYSITLRDDAGRVIKREMVVKE
ncbi:MAG: YCF48-related protein [Saprospiraceae bacterium]